MLIGYARVSSLDQNLDLQQDALIKAGCDPKRIYWDKLSGAKDNRPGLQNAVGFLRPDDTLVVWKLDRLGRSLKHLIEIVEGLNAKGIGFKSITESIDTTTSGGKLIFSIFGALAEYERAIIRERTKAGLASARARGRFGGRPTEFSDNKIAAAKSMADANVLTIGEICESLNISKSTYYRRLSKKEK